MVIASLLLAAALLVAPGTAGIRSRLACLSRDPQPPPVRGEWRLSALAAFLVGGAVAVSISLPAGLAAGVSSSAAMWWFGKRTDLDSTRATPEPADLAAGWDVLAAALRAGATVPAALRIAAEELTGPTQGVLRRVADLLGAGEDADTAWQAAIDHPPTRQLARAVRHSAQSGSALVGVATQLAESARTGAADALEARTQRAGVLVTGPLGLCFLPAFLCLGVLPTVVGLGTELLETW
ncbi:type II secretion system F family protein [Actinoalloteichus hymeniacidonis]|uniref:Type II secretion system protein F n=1 Tax=Actinoalloteichus hymeniacidonis TaxID=340345 RepID=A0AAC9HKT0_9PSEU|nr:type II secretion system F family protein [Actinoalloteichus hymeniacidonis]AOS61133.1 type II secretion system protein F [Actinoalloteichus hymeniacidonis]MBB5910866.1 hypothetical protein [Actinoalloteichus hymeniacidonis]